MKSLVFKAVQLTALLVLVAWPHGLPAQDEKAPQQTEQQEKAPATAKININTASLDQLTTLPRIGPAIAQRILSFREEHGSFEKIEELMNVKGIGQKTFDRLKPLIRL